VCRFRCAPVQDKVEGLFCASIEGAMEAKKYMQFRPAQQHGAGAGNCRAAFTRRGVRAGLQTYATNPNRPAAASVAAAPDV